MKTAEEVFGHLVNLLDLRMGQLSPAKIELCRQSLTAYSEEWVKEVMAPGYLDWSGRIRAEGRKEAFEEAQNLCGPCLRQAQCNENTDGHICSHLQRAVDQGRKEGLEEAAKIAESHQERRNSHRFLAIHIARRIRALKEKP